MISFEYYDCLSDKFIKAHKNWDAKQAAIFHAILREIDLRNPSVGQMTGILRHVENIK